MYMISNDMHTADTKSFLLIHKTYSEEFALARLMPLGKYPFTFQSGD